jgi:hypothetical protein
LVVAQSSSEVPEGLMNDPVLCGSSINEKHVKSVRRPAVKRTVKAC